MERRGSDLDVLLVGSGLANSLIALELDRRRPDLSVTLIEARPEIEEHTWCVFRSDLAPAAWETLSGGFDHVWPGYRVAFPSHSRALTTEYGCLTSHGLRRLLDARPRLRRRTGRVVAMGPDHAVLDGGETLRAPVVIDGRGARDSAALSLGFQKFLGLEVRLRRPHGLTRPMVMDATVRQSDGYRFLYVLPVGEDRLLIEDTRYADGAALAERELEDAVLRYARAQCWLVVDILRRERGVLPVALDGDARAYFAESGDAAPQVGLRGLFFHPTTGYSFPDAARIADLVADEIDGGGERLAGRLRDEAIRLWDERGFYRLLNRMLFRAAEPTERYRVLERFYRLPQPLIERFYAGRTTRTDMLRVLSGKPPVPLWPALRAAAPARLGGHFAGS